MATLSPRDHYTVLINTFQVKPGRIEDLLNLLTRATEETVKHIPGFVSASLHVSLDGKQLVNYAQWSSKAKFELQCKIHSFSRT